ncbi:hypothetical protein LVY72_04865 [Arthrobacter sp. I2-34]|uniref:Stress-response A/B barrel domain-containing protein n=1 Tax=Arthrobacter hankyongi TaxID=2904801 RepID=A0ABS9L3W2_9MICC|nr:hypothetical protein [Arthrobacter hankyongi]MCG2621243.1 hypothetical protein [Arthrobacter hankyongi]
MIRRFYVMPLNPGATEERIDEFLKALSDSDRFISGLLDSSAGVDLDTRTVVWEMTFVDEETYTGPYMVHPYHMATLDNYLIADSPESLAHDIDTTRYTLPDSVPRLEEGVRRVVLMKLPEGTDTSMLETLAAQGEGMAASVFSPDNVAWRFPTKDLNWTHVWEQGFTDMAALNHYLKTAEGIACSSLEGFKRLGIDARSLKILTYPFKLKPAQSPPNIPSEPFPILYTITARTALEDVDTYIDLLERDYDPPLADVGAKLLHRWRTVDHAYTEAEVQSTWQLDSVAAFSDLRIMTVTNPSWNRFVLEGMPLVRSGTRRFYRAV